MDKNELMIEALTQRIAEITASYERRIADIRADFTIMHEKVKSQEGTENVEVVAEPRTSDVPASN